MEKAGSVHAHLRSFVHLVRFVRFVTRCGFFPAPPHTAHHTSAPRFPLHTTHGTFDWFGAGGSGRRYCTYGLAVRWFAGCGCPRRRHHTCCGSWFTRGCTVVTPFCTTTGRPDVVHRVFSAVNVGLGGSPSTRLVLLVLFADAARYTLPRTVARLRCACGGFLRHHRTTTPPHLHHTTCLLLLTLYVPPLPPLRRCFVGLVLVILHLLVVHGSQTLWFDVSRAGTLVHLHLSTCSGHGSFLLVLVTRRTFAVCCGSFSLARG
jgi:hypothetical protein